MHSTLCILHYYALCIAKIRLFFDIRNICAILPPKYEQPFPKMVASAPQKTRKSHLLHSTLCIVHCALCCSTAIPVL